MSLPVAVIQAWLHSHRFRTNLGILFCGVIIMAPKMKVFFWALEKMMLQNQGQPTSDLPALLTGNFSDAPGHSLIFSAPQTPLVIPSESLPGPSQSPVPNSNILVTLELSVNLCIVFIHSTFCCVTLSSLSCPTRLNLCSRQDLWSSSLCISSLRGPRLSLSALACSLLCLKASSPICFLLSRAMSRGSYHPSSILTLPLRRRCNLTEALRHRPISLTALGL